MSDIFSIIDFSAPSHEVAPQLIGAQFFVNGVGGIIVEVEAYDQSEPASHTFSGPSARNASMFGAPGCAYVYRSYGIHWCLNFVCSPEGHGAGILIRAIQPTKGLEIMRARRGVEAERLLCSGPGRVGQALGIIHAFTGRSLRKRPFKLLPAVASVDVIHGPRIGISKAMDLPWRFGLAGSPFLSKPFR
ncbi:putative DNA-3-methyladenine glycosidase [Cellvibrio sp. BR]|uniref:DNA-3-methyladenine glycosylase n=1 Tax=Cellvibrio sp. BR TaxID=1134474 RepID=UPI0002600EEA|nr:DNA-3-methyladenine glycosylase [Cellvibrio sp. BR]EIK47103.1 putative DNA-3-methyladenine glycosidase [Cellvibrio sp. BR]